MKLFVINWTEHSLLIDVASVEIDESVVISVAETSTYQNLLFQVIMCSSAGVTRPSWDEEKKLRYPGAADIPIVRLNPFNILNVKKDGTEKISQWT